MNFDCHHRAELSRLNIQIGFPEHGYKLVIEGFRLVRLGGSAERWATALATIAIQGKLDLLHESRRQGKSVVDNPSKEIHS